MTTTKNILVERGKTLNWKIEKENYETIIDKKVILTKEDETIVEKMILENSLS